MEKEFLQELIAFMQQKGFVWGPEPEIYGGMAGFYSYGPLGKLLKNNVEYIIRKTFQKNGFFEVEFPTIAPKKVWEASGHLSGFTDPMVECKKCKSSFKVEQLIEELFPNKNVKDFESFFKKHEVKCPNCKSLLPKDVSNHNLMMKTFVGIGGEAYCRPETATTTYLQFLRCYDFFRKKLPFGVFQIGPAYRNEISPRQHLLRTREFTQAEGQLFIFDHQKKDYKPFETVKNEKIPFWSWSLRKDDKTVKKISLGEALKNKWLKNKAYAYFLYLTYKTFLELGFPDDRIRLNQHSPDDKAFYADDAWDIEVKLNSFGWTELCGVHDRTDYDLKQHAKFSGKSMDVLDEESGKKKTPHILEFAYGPSRITFALLDIFYNKKSEQEGKTILSLPPRMAPIKISVFPLLRKPELIKLANKVYDDLSSSWLCKYDETASIGKRYLRSAEEGIPFAITIDFDSLEDKSVTVRNRDTEKQKRVKISELKEKLFVLLKQ
ncbi:MAG: glycine--tRNA ligase [Nanoarchaeota archaeon]|nr:glycine--tRNA ligase [Nanoarchaeota archaeon]MBU1030701.1 glycine--tRNA ligase [Nanoarchaeota archaeon]MBU1849564.1 glycine--tRNA ligase [Nanoarchaeota archaeon]